MSCERYEGSGWWTGEGDETDLDNNCAAVRDDSGGGNDLSSAIEAWTQVFDAFDVCSYFKFNNNGFRCFDKPKPPSTKEQAIERYNSEYPPETICAPLKQNSPFQCIRTVEASMVTRLSLSLASAQAVFALVGVLFVSILRKIKKSDQAPSTVYDDDLRILVRKLRDGQGRHEELIQNLLKKAGDHQA